MIELGFQHKKREAYIIDEISDMEMITGYFKAISLNYLNNNSGHGIHKVVVYF